MRLYGSDPAFRTASASSFTDIPAVIQVLQNPLPVLAVQAVLDEGLDFQRGEVNVHYAPHPFLVDIDDKKR